MLGDRDAHYGLVVDRILGEEKLVVKPIDPRLGKIPNLSSMALRSDGSIVFILDSEDLLQSMQKLQSPRWQTAGSGESGTSIDGQRKKILVIDDSITVRETERKLLENQGYLVDTAVNGADGWNTLQLNTYDLVITDIDMPRMNGIELVGQMKRHHTLQTIPTIIISYKDREEDRLQGLEVGANYYLTKSSFQDDTLVQAVLDLIGPAIEA
jgi:two-component system, chemotaxis family, sensor histidine kinase and response regulator WspE